MNNFKKNTIKLGIIWMMVASIIIVGAPIFVCFAFHTSIDWAIFAAGLMAVVPIYWPVSFVEVLTYTPMLGIGGTFLAFVTGNVTNIKIPAVLNATETNNIKSGTNEYEIIATIAVAVSSIATTLIVAIGVLALSQITPVLNSPSLSPVFDNILPALFGGLGYMYFKKNWKIAITPCVFMLIMFIAIPPLASMVGIMVPVGIIVSLIAARIMFKKNIL